MDAYRNHSWPASSAGYEDDQPIDLRFYLEALLRHKWLIFFLTVALSLGAAGYVLTTKRVYSATARVQVQQSSGRYITITGQPAYYGPPSSDAAESLKTQVKFVYSSLTLGEAVRYLREQQGIVVPPDAFRGLKVIPEEPDVIAISVEHESPRMAATLANAVATAYRDQNTLQARRQARGAQEYIRQRLDEIRSDLAKVEEQMKPLKIRQHIPWNETGDMTRAMQVAAYEDQARQAELEVASLQSRVRALRNQIASHPQYREIERPAEDPFLTGLRQEKVRLEV
ncbi:MAG: GumC family protein, partial [Armatimonadota bacterium]